MCDRYKETSAQMHDKREQQLMKEVEKKYVERKLDQEFANRLRDIDLEPSQSSAESESTADNSKGATVNDKNTKGKK
jgi:hypothetical protein